MSQPWEQYGPYNTGAMNMAGGNLGNYGPQSGYYPPSCPPACPPSCPPPHPPQCLPPCPPPCPPGRSGAPYMQWGQGNLGGFNVSNPGGGNDNIYGSAAAGSGNMPGSNTISGPRNAYVQRGGPSSVGGSSQPCYGGDPCYGVDPYYGGMLGPEQDATNITNPAFGEHRGPVSMGASNISISNTATYLSSLAPRTGGEYRGPYGQSGCTGPTGSQTRLLGGDMRPSGLSNDSANEIKFEPENLKDTPYWNIETDNQTRKPKILCENCRNTCRQTGGMNRSMSQPSLKSIDFGAKETKTNEKKNERNLFQNRHYYRPSLFEEYNKLQKQESNK